MRSGATKRRANLDLHEPARTDFQNHAFRVRGVNNVSARVGASGCGGALGVAVLREGNSTVCDESERLVEARCAFGAATNRGSVEPDRT